MPRIAVDLTPLLPGGENGAAKLLVLELLTQFKELVHPYNFLLLTADWNHQEMAAFDGPRFQRSCVLRKAPPSTDPNPVSNSNLLWRAKHRLHQGLPEQVVLLLSPLYRKIIQRWNQLTKISDPPKISKGLLADQEVDLLFCPLTAPTYEEPGIPVVSIFYDLQHHTYPYFFDPKELEGRDATLNWLRQRVESIICISEFSRQTLLENLDIAPEQTYTIPVSIHSRLCETTPALSILETLELNVRPYFFYPANFWPHKNHRMLLTAYNILLHRNPGLDIDLVFTGAPSQQEKKLQDEVEAMGLTKRVHFLGYLSDGELSAVFQGCQLLIFPSLYEGFGVPLLEAFTFGKPVLCSNIGSLPEIGGKAAYYFDPRKPLEIVKAIERLFDKPDLAQDLVQRGYQRLAAFRKEDMGKRYLEVFNETLQKNKIKKENILGLFSDGWLGEKMGVYYGADQKAQRTIEFTLSAPDWLPHRKVTIRNGKKMFQGKRWIIRRGQTVTLGLPLLDEGGQIELWVSPIFNPSETMSSSDNRCLSCLCPSCRIVYPDGSEKILSGG